MSNDPYVGPRPTTPDAEPTGPLPANHYDLPATVEVFFARLNDRGINGGYMGIDWMRGVSPPLDEKRAYQIAAQTGATVVRCTAVLTGFYTGDHRLREMGELVPLVTDVDALLALSEGGDVVWTKAAGYTPLAVGPEEGRGEGQPSGDDRILPLGIAEGKAEGLPPGVFDLFDLINGSDEPPSLEEMVATLAPGWPPPSAGADAGSDAETVPEADPIVIHDEEAGGDVTLPIEPRATTEGGSWFQFFDGTGRALELPKRQGADAAQDFADDYNALHGYNVTSRLDELDGDPGGDGDAEE